MNIKQRNLAPLPAEVNELKELFNISLELCRQRALELILQYPKNLPIVQITAACQSLLGNYAHANTHYQTCLDLAPDLIAFYNNLAWNHIALEDYMMAATFLNDIKQKWNHPSIYYNLALSYERGRVRDISLLDEAVQKMERYRHICPDFQSQKQKGLIHTFLLKPEQNFSKDVECFDIQLYESVGALQNMLQIQFDSSHFDTLNLILEQTEQKMAIRKDQEEKYGIVIYKPIKVFMEVLSALRTIIFPCYKKQWSKEINKVVVYSILMLDKNIFRAQICKETDYEQTQREKILPCILQLQELAEQMLAIVRNLQEKKQRQLIIKLKPIDLPPKNFQEQVSKPEPIKIPEHLDRQKKDFEKKNSLKQQMQISIPANNQDRQRERGELIEQKNQLNEQQQNIDMFVSIIHVQNQPHVSDQIKEEDPNQPEILVQNSLLNQLLQKDEQIRIDENIQQNRYQRPDFPKYQYNFHSRLAEKEEVEKQFEHSMEKILRVQGQNVHKPLFVLLHFKNKESDVYNVYLNINRIGSEILGLPQMPNLNRLPSQQSRNLVKKYYFVLNVMLKFYNFYGTHNFEYRRKNLVTNLELNDFVDLITPVLNHVFEDEELFQKEKFGWLVSEIHFALCRYVGQTNELGKYLKTVQGMLKRVHLIVKRGNDVISSLLNDIHQAKYLMYSQVLLNHELIPVNGLIKYHEYYNWKMNSYHIVNKDQTIRLAFTSEDNWIISNVSLLLITLAEKELDQDGNLLSQAFSDCFYQSKSITSYRERILHKFYTVNHDIAPIEKAGIYFRKIISKVIPW